MHQIDLAATKELEACKRIEALSIEIRKDRAQKLLTSKEMQQLEAFCLSVTNNQSTVKVIRTEAEISTYLSDIECIPDWSLASTVTFRIQNRYVAVDENIAVWEECRIRAHVFLDLGASIIEYLKPVKLDLQERADEILLAMRMKLNVIKTFNPMFQYRTQFEIENRLTKASHHFVDLLVDFNHDDLLPTNVAEAYPAIDNSEREAVVEIY